MSYRTIIVITSSRTDWRRPQTPPPEACPLDTFARCAGFNASRPFRQGGKESVWLEIAARRGGGERQMPHPLFDRAFRALFIYPLKVMFWLPESFNGLR